MGIALVGAMACGSGGDTAPGDAAGGVDAIAADAAPREPLLTYAADDPAIRYEGRWDRSTPAAPRAAWSGAAIRLRVDAAEVVLQVTEAGQWKRQNAITVFVDGVRVATHDLVEGAQELQVATGLADGPHDVLIAKSTEAMRGMITIDGLRLVDARPLGPPPAPATALQFIGDSITCAGGNIGPSDSGCDATDYEDGGQGFPMLTAAAMDAELDVVCQSGIALWRNASPILDYYQAQVLPFVDGEPAATPRAATHVVINLGTNDLSGGDPPEAEYKAALHALLDAVRADSPTATVLLVVGPIVAGPSADLLEGWYGEVATERADPLMRTLRLPGQNEAPGQVACSHPNAALHADIAAILLDELAP